MIEATVHKRNGLFSDPKTVFTAFIATLLTLMPEMALAGDNPIGDVLCEIVSWFTGAVGKGVASLAIIVLGIMALFGKANPAMAISVVIGITMMFGATPIVNELQISGLAAVDCSTLGVGAIDDNNQIALILCRVAQWFRGDVGTAIATTGVVLLGVGAVFGKVSVPQAMYVTAGVTLIYGFTAVVDQMVTPIGVTASCDPADIDQVTTLGSVLCQVAGWLNSDIGRGIGIAGVVMMGGMSLFGRISWGLGITGATGVVLIFGASAIVDTDLNVNDATGAASACRTRMGVTP